ncbi:MAG: DMT family transporter, partial [Anaerolineae bacterium]
MEKSQAAADQTTRIFGLADLMLLLLVLIWGVNFTVLKTALQEMSPLAFNGLRFGLATVLMVGLARGIEGNLSLTRRDVRALLVLGLVGNTCYQ